MNKIHCEQIKDGLNIFAVNDRIKNINSGIREIILVKLKKEKF